MARNEKSYRTLGLKPDSSLEEIARAHERMKSAWDPDRFVGNAPLEKKAAEKLKAIERAYTTLLEAHGIDVSDGPPPSLFDDALAERLAKPRKRLSKRALGAIVAVATALILVLWLGSGDEPPAGEETTTADQQEIEDLTPSTSETTPDQKQPAVETSRPKVQQPEPASSAGKPTRSAPRRSTPIDVAFEMLQAESPTVRRLVSGGYPELRYRGWKALKADPPEVTIALLAEKQGDDEATTYLWTINMETEKVKALNKQAVELDAPRRTGSRPKLVRQE